MRVKIFAVLFWAWIFAGSAAWADPLHIESAVRKTTLIEIFSSEGCSSCPPAEAWASSLTDAGQLWRDFVPVVFHVDYWDRLGWKDRFSSAAFTKRQGDYVEAWHQSTLYTPGFVLNGRPWRGWRRGKTIPRQNKESGILRVEEQQDGSYKVSFEPAGDFASGIAHAALLGFGIKVEVTRGENAGRTLRHDFTVLDFQSAPLQGHPLSAFFKFDAGKFSAARLGLAAWVTKSGGKRPVQAVGGYLS